MLSDMQTHPQFTQTFRSDSTTHLYFRQSDSAYSDFSVGTRPVWMICFLKHKWASSFSCCDSFRLSAICSKDQRGWTPWVPRVSWASNDRFHPTGDTWGYWQVSNRLYIEYLWPLCWSINVGFHECGPKLQNPAQLICARWDRSATTAGVHVKARWTPVQNRLSYLWSICLWFKGVKLEAWGGNTFS